MSIKIFLSTVSDEFRTYRDALRHDLTRHNVEVKVQEDFKDLGADTLDMLDVYIAHCDAVVHLSGNMTGAYPGYLALGALQKKHPDLADKLPPLGDALKNGESISYTQWEAWLALYHGKLLFIAKAADNAERGPNYAPTNASCSAQSEHLARLRQAERYPGCTFRSPADLAKHIAYTAILDLLVKAYVENPARAREVTGGGNWAGSPYPGLRPFTTGEARIFFGRETEANKISDLLREPDPRFLAIVGGSGTGKSSLVYAGILPLLHNGDSPWPSLSFTPGFANDNPFTALAYELFRQLPRGEISNPAELSAKLEKRPEFFLQYVHEIAAPRSNNSAFILFIDQFEELFKNSAETHRKYFVELMVKAASDPGLRVVITLRTDFLDQFMKVSSLSDLAQRAGAVFPMAPPKKHELRRMICCPAQATDTPFDDELAEALLADAGSEPGEALPLVAFCLQDLYRRTPPGRALNLDTYHNIGGLRGAIALRTSEILEKLQVVECAPTSAIFSRLFGLLVHVDAGGKAVRKWASLDSVRRVSGEAQQIVDTLVAERLLLVGPSENGAVIALSHEALIQSWPSLHEWLDQNRVQMQRVQRYLLHLLAPEPADRLYGVTQIEAMAEKATEAIPALVVALGDGDENVARKATKALGQMKDAIPALGAALSAHNENVRANAAEALGNIGPAAVDAIPELMSALSDKSWNVRAHTADALGHVGPPAASAVPALSAALSDDNVSVRACAAEALGNIGPAAATAVQALSTALGDVSDERLRVKAAGALKKIGAAAADAVQALSAALSDKNDTVRLYAAEALDNIGRAAAPAVPALCVALGDKDEDVRSSAAAALVKIGPAAVTALSDILGAGDELARRGATDALVKIGQAAVPALCAALGPQNDEGVRRNAANTLGRIGQAAVDAVPTLVRALLIDVSEWVRLKAAEALSEIGPHAADVVPALVKALSDKSKWVRQSAAGALARIGPPAISALRNALGDENELVREGATDAFVKTSRSAIPTLRSALGDKIRWCAGVLPTPSSRSARPRSQR